jgi:corrinoid protein of di/trimethylamine methyltransferase
MSMTHRERILRVARGEKVDKIPWVPRIDLWHNANELAGTLPKKYQGLSVEEIHIKEGWPLHKIIPEYLKPEKPEDIIHRAIGLYKLKEFPYDFEFSSDVDIHVKTEENDDEYMTRVEYHTPKGLISVCHGYTGEMQKSGASITWVKEHAIKSVLDYPALAHIFGTLKLKPAYDRFSQWKNFVGEDGVAFAQGLGIACSSPMHFIQKTLLSATDFYLHYKDHHKEMEELAEAIANCYNQLISILADSPADIVLWSANVDDMITYPAYFEKDIVPWCKKASDALHANGILAAMHSDGENKGLMDLIPQCGMDIADAVTPYPMTKVRIEEYYDRWCRTDKLTIHGGIPEMMLIEESSTWDDLKTYLAHMFKVISPGNRLIVSIGDTSPPSTEFDRLIYIGDQIEKYGRLPLEAGSYNPVINEKELKASDDLYKAPQASDKKDTDENSGSDELDPGFAVLRQDVLDGDEKKLITDVIDMLEQKFDAQDILNMGMLSAMEEISKKFKDGTVFIPEVLLSARALNEALQILETYLAEGAATGGDCKILIGTVEGDLHDIGKNMVSTMLKGVGFDVIDLGVNVKVKEFVRQVKETKADILGISALLTTTMPQMKKVIDALEEEGVRDQIKVIVGGAPVNRKFADDIGADGYAQDAGEAVELVKFLKN